MTEHKMGVLLDETITREINGATFKFFFLGASVAGVFETTIIRQKAGEMTYKIVALQSKTIIDAMLKGEAEEVINYLAMQCNARYYKALKEK